MTEEYIASYYDDIGNKYRHGGFSNQDEAREFIESKEGLDGKIYVTTEPNEPIWTAPDVQ